MGNFAFKFIVVFLCILGDFSFVDEFGSKIVGFVLVLDFGAGTIVVQIGVRVAGGWPDDVAFSTDVGVVLLFVVEWTTTAACFYFSIHFCKV